MIEPIPAEIVNWTILDEITYMDPNDPDFSRDLAQQFFQQAETTFSEISAELNGNKNLEELEKLGHFIKGSSAALGLQRIAWACERIQNLSRKVEKTFPSKESLLSSLPKGVVMHDLDLKVYNKNYEGVQPTTDGDELYIFLIKRALAQAYFEFQIARQELSIYFHEQV